LLASLLIIGAGPFVYGQTCDPSTVPSGLTATVIPGSGVLLEWDAIPGSTGIALRANSPTGTRLTRRLMGSALDQYLVPESVLQPGHYLWQVQGACTVAPPYGVTDVSANSGFTVSSGDCSATMTDQDGQSYPTVPIGNQCWMAENLRASSFANGDPIPTGLSKTDWANDSDGAFAVYNDDPANAPIYGHLYNWYAVDDVRGICPTGWHVPSDAEWDTLRLHIRSLGGPPGSKLKSVGNLSDGTGLWLAPNDDAINSSGFNGHPAGVRNWLGNYFAIGISGIWWSSTESIATSTKAYIRFLGYNSDQFGRNDDIKEVGQSVRCIRD
jgi:uncharacterized protein (TIGR02145 family)